MKKIATRALLAFLLVAMILAVAACNGNKDDPAGTTGSEITEATQTTEATVTEEQQIDYVDPIGDDVAEDVFD